MAKMTWKQAKIHGMEIRFGTAYEVYRDFDDDRKVFANLYEQIMRALNSLPEEPDSYIKVAIWRQLCRDKEVLNSIDARFVNEV